MKTFAVKTRVVELDADGKRTVNLISLGSGLTWAEALELKKANKGSWTHRENNVYETVAQ